MKIVKPDEWVTVGRAPIEVVAEMMRSRLETEGIDAVLRGNIAAGTAGAVNELNISWNNPLGGVEVRVRSDDEERAREILAEGGDANKSHRSTPLWLRISAALFVAGVVHFFTSSLTGNNVVGFVAAFVIFGALLFWGRRSPS